MQVDSNIGLSRAAESQAPTPPRKVPSETGRVDLAKTDALDAALKAAPEVRAEQVARARTLLRDPGYPSDKVMNQVAEVLARHIRSKE